MSKLTVFAQLLNDEAEMSVLEELTDVELKKVKNSASSAICRPPKNNTEAKLKRAREIMEMVNAELTKRGTKATVHAEWRVKPVEELSLEQMKLAKESAQWYKSTYSPGAQLMRRSLINNPDADPIDVEKAKNWLITAEARYEQALKDEAYWNEQIAKFYPSKAPATKVKAQEEAISEALKLVNKAGHFTKSDRAALKDILSKYL